MNVELGMRPPARRAYGPEGRQNKKGDGVKGRLGG